jgi:hypothetical protein
VRDFLATQGARPVGSSAAEYGQIIQREIGMWRGVIQKAGVTVQ